MHLSDDSLITPQRLSQPPSSPGGQVMVAQLIGCMEITCATPGSSLPSSLSLGCDVQLEVSHGVTQVRLTPYRWRSNKIKKTWVPESTEAHNEEERGFIGLVETLRLYRGQEERKKLI